MKIVKGNNSIYTRLKSWVSSWQFLVLFGIILSLGLHIYTVADIMKAPPSENFSCEIKIGEAEYGNSKFSSVHMTAALSDEQDRVGIFTVDGTRSKLYIIDTKGSILEEISLSLDLFNATNIKGYFSNKSEFTIFYKTDALYSAVIDINSGSFVNEKKIDVLEAFENEDSLVVFSKEDGLYGLNIDKPDLGESLIIPGDIVSFSMYEDNNLIYIVGVTGVTKNHEIYVDGHLMVLNKNYEILSEYTVFSDTKDPRLEEVKDIYYKDGLLSSIFIRNDKAAGQNDITTIQVNTNSGKELARFTKIFDRFSGKKIIADASSGSVSLIMQKMLVNGVNIVKNTIENEKIITMPLTKTRRTSVLPSYLESNGDKILIFSDLKNEGRDIYFATSNPKIISNTSSFKTINYLLVSGTSIGLFLVAVILSLIITIGVVIIPSVALVIMNKMTKKYKYKNIVHIGVVVFTHIVIKICVIAAINKNKFSDFLIQLNFFGSEPNTYVLLVISSLFSLLCTYKFMKQKEEYTATKAYVFFAIVDMLFYAFTNLVYIVTSALLHNIY